MGNTGSSTIRSRNATWQGGNPWDDDLFETNAIKSGLTIHEDKNLNRSYVVLKKDTTFYHATRPQLVNTILKEGLKTQNKQGKQVDGIYLSGGEHLKEWFGSDTAMLQVTVKAGTRLYQDVQPNAVFVRKPISSKYIKKWKGNA